MSSRAARSRAAFHQCRLPPFRRHRLFNVFVPLVDLEEDGDGTMLWPGSHLERTRYDAYHAATQRSERLEDDAIAMGQMEVPRCPAGERSTVMVVPKKGCHRLRTPMRRSMSRGRSNE